MFDFSSISHCKDRHIYTRDYSKITSRLRGGGMVIFVKNNYDNLGGMGVVTLFLCNRDFLKCLFLQLHQG